MSNTDERVMAAVRAALDENPAASVDELFEMGKAIAPSVGELSKRQFHARYPLQIKRRLKPRKRRKKRQSASKAKTSSAGAAAAHEGVRRAFLDFASELAAAEERKDVVRVVASVDKYVVEALKAAGLA